jgi:hypothetical protein
MPNPFTPYWMTFPATYPYDEALTRRPLLSIVMLQLVTAKLRAPRIVTASPP